MFDMFFICSFMFFHDISIKLSQLLQLPGREAAIGPRSGEGTDICQDREGVSLSAKVGSMRTRNDKKMKS